MLYKVKYLRMKTYSIDAALEILGDKWSARILKALAEQPECRFCEFESRLPGISPRTLTARLKKLESTGIIEKTILPNGRPSYALTQKGIDLLDVVSAMSSWSQKYS